MNEMVVIQPTRSTVGAQPVLEIALPGVPRGLVLLLCDRGGLERDATEVMNRLAEHGFESLAAEAHGPDLLQPLLARSAERGWEPEQIGMVGLGVGGRAVLEAATELRLGAAVSFSPTGEHGVADDPTRALVTPWLGMFGADDPAVSAEVVGDLAGRLSTESDVYSSVVTYPGVGRDFYRHHDDGVSYAASYDGWQRAVEWLELRVAPRLTPLAERWRRRKTAVSA